MFSIFQETPFTTRDLEFIYFFFPFIITATVPTLLAIGWKNVNPNRVLTDEQFWLATCYVQVRFVDSTLPTSPSLVNVSFQI